MEGESTGNSARDPDNVDQSVSFQHVTAVATEWMMDFMFVSLCRYFKEGKFEEFNETLTVFEAISDSTFLQAEVHNEKTLICAFLARVMHGKELDVQFEENDNVMPLMSAAKIWSKLELTVADEQLFKNINILLFVQSVAVCLEKGQKSSATTALKWFEKNYKFPQNLGAKLTAVMTQKETYHPLLVNLSFSQLQETIKSFLDIYLEKSPSDNLLKEATKMVLLSQNGVRLEDKEAQDICLTETTSDPKIKGSSVLRTKRKLLSNKITDVWKPDSCKKPCVSIRKLSTKELSQVTPEKSRDISKIQRKRKPRQNWTHQLDKYLIAGVKRHGEGKWSRILLDHDFEGRTGTMLKDRWRVLVKAHKVS